VPWTEIIALVTSLISIGLVLFREWFAWRARKRLEREEKEKVLAIEKKVYQQVMDRLTSNAKNENDGIDDMEDRIDKDRAAGRIQGSSGR